MNNKGNNENNNNSKGNATTTKKDEAFSDLELQHRKYMLLMIGDMSNKYKRS